VTWIVAAVLPLMLVLLIILAWGLMGMAKGNGKLVIKTKTAVIPPKIEFFIEYTSHDRPPSGGNPIESPGTALPAKAEPGSGVADVT
jgi:hypothetical protein